MNIIEAARAMGDGKIVKRIEWDTEIPGYYARRSHAAGIVVDDNSDELVFAVSDLLADDWEVVDEQV